MATTREEIEAVFSVADKDGSGQLNIKEFLASSKAVNMVKEAENSSSSKSSGQKRWEDYYNGFAMIIYYDSRKGSQAPPPQDKAEMAFKLYDKDKDGYITRAEMVKLSKTLTKEQVEKVMLLMCLQQAGAELGQAQL